MRLTLVRGGGVGGLVTSTQVSSDALPPDDADVLAEKTRQAGALAHPEPASAGARHPDELLYAMTVEDQGREWTLKFREGTLPEEVRNLIAWIDSRPEREDTIE